MNLGTHMPDGERRKPIDIEVCMSKVKVTLSIHMFATRLSHLWYVTDFFFLLIYLQHVVLSELFKFVILQNVWKKEKINRDRGIQNHTRRNRNQLKIR